MGSLTHCVAIVLACLTTHVTSMSLSGAPPVVVEMSPDNGDIDVDPATTELRVTFDQPMTQRGLSVVGGGDSFPEIMGTPRWVDPQTIVVPIRLRPNHEYWLSINNQAYQNFKSATGESAVPYPVRFRTGGGADGVAPGQERTLTNEQNERAVDALIDVLTRRYSHHERLGIDWESLVESKRELLVSLETPQQFGEIAGTLLAKARDKHVWFDVDGKRFPSYIAPAVPNVNTARLPHIIPNWKRLSSAVATGRWDDGIGYISIETWDHGSRESIEAAFDAIRTFHDCDGLIIDVRLNGGGDELIAQEVAGCFIDDKVTYARHEVRDADRPTGFTTPRNRILRPNRQQPQFRGSVAVLTGPVVMSSCEGFLLMMKQVPGCILVGSPSQGSSGNPRPYELGNDVTVYVPSWRSMHPDGTVFEGIGIAPDVPVVATGAQMRQRDPVVEAALAQLRTEHQPDQ